MSPARKKLTHIDGKGAARMVDVGAKAVTERRAVARGRDTFARPCIRRSAGRTKISKVTSADTVLPGSPKIGTRRSPSLSSPNARGRPGRMAMAQKSIVPSSESTGFMKSWSPTDTPPLVTIASAATTSRKAARSASGESRTMPRTHGSAPTARIADASV